MSRVLTVSEICERALRKIGVVSINDSAAPGGYVDEARWWLDMVVGHIVAKQRRWWMVPVSHAVTLTAGQAEYPAATSLGEAAGIMHVVSVWRVSLTDASDRAEVTIMRRSEWEGREAAGSTGIPEAVYVDRADKPTIRVHPTPSAPILHQLEVVYHRFGPDYSPRVSNPNMPLDAMRQTWNLAIVHALAAEIGNGPIRKLPADEVRDLQLTAKRLLDDLDAYDAHEQAGEPRRVSYNDF